MNFGGLGGLFGGLTGNFGGNNAFGGFNAPKDAFGLPTAVAKTHLGIASCNLLKDYTNSYPCLREVGILLKEFLNIHDLNSAYRGKHHSQWHNFLVAQTRSDSSNIYCASEKLL